MTNSMGRMKRAVSEIYRELEERGEEVGLNIRVKKTKGMPRRRKRRRRRKRLEEG
jgi:hypothetical protein